MKTIHKFIHAGFIFNIILIIVLLTLVISDLCAQTGARPVYQPDYSILTPGTFRTVIDATGLRSGVTNAYGIVDGSENVGTIISTPPATSLVFTDNGIAGARIKRVMVNGIPVLDFQGNRWFRSTAAASTWDFFSFASPFSSMRWTVTIMMRCGYGSEPGNIQGIVGTNGTSSGAKGFGIWSDDRDATGTNTITHNITKGTAGAISVSGDNSQMVPNTWDIWRFTFDGSLTAANRFKAYKNGTQVTTTVTSASTAVVTNPTNTLEIGNLGGGPNTAGFVGQISHVVLQNVVESTVTADAFEATLQPIRTALNNTDGTYLHPYKFVSENGTRYFLPVNMSQDPTAPNIVSRIYRESTNHIPDATSELKNQISTDYGVTWGSPTVVYTTGGASGPNFGAMAGGYDASGRLWMIGEKRNIGAVNSLPFELWKFYSDDNGVNWTFSDISSIVPADGYDFYSPLGKMAITSTGRMLISLYKVNIAATHSALYALYSDDNGTTWGTKTIRAPAIGYLNETEFVICGSRIIAYARDEGTKEYNVYYSTDNGDTWIDDGAETFGESWASGAPITFSQFDLYGVNVTAAWFCDRNAAVAPFTFYGVFARTSTLASNAHDFDLDTKTAFRGRIVHYGTVVHPRNDLYAIGSFSEEPITNPFDEDNRIISFYVGDRVKDLIMKELLITRQ